MIERDYSDAKDHVHVLSYGGGTQSTALLLKSLKDGINGIKPDYIIFADTGNESRAVLAQIERVNKHIKEKYGREIITVSNGNILNRIKKHFEEGERMASIPFFTLNRETGKKGILWRACTDEYKITPVRREIRRLLGYKPKQRVKEIVHLWKGISTDEIQRVKPIRDKWQEAEHPLIDYLDWSRDDCVDYVNVELGFRPISSSCIICPFHSRNNWLEIKRNSPEEFEEACQIDEMIRHNPKLDSECFLYAKHIPLRDIEAEPNSDDGDYFDNECNGICGL